MLIAGPGLALSGLMIVAISAAVVGFVIWIFAAHPKASEAGRLLFAIGLFVIVAMLATNQGLRLPSW